MSVEATRTAKILPYWGNASRQGEYYQLRMDRAHKRYLSALKTLALARKLPVPVLQVNIAKKQVNVAGVSPAWGRRGRPVKNQPGQRRGRHKTTQNDIV
jgi:hypothetical protein